MSEDAQEYLPLHTAIAVIAVIAARVGQVEVEVEVEGQVKSVRLLSLGGTQ